MWGNGATSATPKAFVFIVTDAEYDNASDAKIMDLGPTLKVIILMTDGIHNWLKSLN